MIKLADPNLEKYILNVWFIYIKVKKIKCWYTKMYFFKNKEALSFIVISSTRENNNVNVSANSVNISVNSVDMRKTDYVFYYWWSEKNYQYSDGLWSTIRKDRNVHFQRLVKANWIALIQVHRHKD